MQNQIYTLSDVFSAFYIIKNKHAKKRLILNQKPLGGLDVKWLKLFFSSLPILLYIGIFNSWMFNMLGIASAIVFFVVFLSMVMITIALLTFANNNKVLRMSSKTWSKYFEDIALADVMTSRATPYKDFLKYYNEALKENLEDEALIASLKLHFIQMQEDNINLYEAMNRNKNI